MGRLKTILLIIVLVLTTQMTFAQKVVVSGRVTDGSYGDPIIGGTIVEQDEDQRIISGTVTDVNGNYTFEVSGKNALLVFSSIGYKSQSIDLEGQTSLDIVLESDYIELQGAEIVAVRKYVDPLTNISERDRTGSSVKLELDASTTAGVTSVEDAMQGQLSGVEIVGSGDPGSGGSIVIRGLGTLGNSAPLIVLDGIPQDVQAGGDFDFSTADAEDIGLLVSIAPQDIRTIEVLKDASSTAIWGTKGANGVIQIETITGKNKIYLPIKIDPNGPQASNTSFEW